MSAMSNYKHQVALFNTTAQGYLHVAKGLACEDASGILFDDEMGWYMFAVADGHGDTSCTRSANGSKFAVSAALTVMSTLASETEWPGFRQSAELDLVSNIKNEIVSKWRSSCEKDVQDNPLDDDERAILAGEDAGGIKNKHYYLYGTTLVAGILKDGRLLLLQQGDGCCAVMDWNGEWSIPIDEDERCVGNVTTSLSDDDANDSMRHAVLDFECSKIALVIVSTDGIDKSTMGNSQLFDWFDSLLPLLSIEKPKHEIVEELTQRISDLSERGSGDDASLACLVDYRRIDDRLLAKTAHRHDRYVIKHEMDDISGRLISMQRKHDYLAGLWEAGREDEAQEYPSCHAEYLRLQERLSQLEEQLAAQYEAHRSEGELGIPKNNDTIAVNNMPTSSRAPSNTLASKKDVRDLQGQEANESNLKHEEQKKLHIRPKTVIPVTVFLALLIGASLALLVSFMPACMSRKVEETCFDCNSLAISSINGLNKSIDGIIKSIESVELYSGFVVVFAQNGAEGIQMPPHKLFKGEVGIILPGCEYHREGYTFLGWGVNPNDENPKPPGDYMYIDDSTTIVYAIWQDNNVVPYGENTGSIDSIDRVPSEYME